MNSNETLTASDVWGLADVLNGMAAGAKCRRLMPNGDIAEGTMRHLTGPDFGPRPDDVRDAFLRVTLRTGLETVWPVTELARQVQVGEFAVDYPDWAKAKA